MNLIILASHGELAMGMKHTASMIIGESDRIHAFSAYRDEDGPIELQVKELVEEYYAKDDIYILTDILGGSVNTSMMQLIVSYPKIQLVSGMNLPLVISIATQTHKITEDELCKIITESKEAILNCSKLIKESVNEEVDDL